MDLRLTWPTWIGVVVDDLQAQRRFYRDVLGLPEMDVGEDWVQFDFGEGRIFELLQRSGLLQYDHPRYQVGFLVEDIRAAAEELVSRGVDRLTEIEGGPESTQYWCYLRDPEGNVFEIVEKLPSR